MNQATLPFSGRSATARACSMRAAQDAATHRAHKSSRVLHLVTQAGRKGLTRHDLASLTGYPISTLCSTLDALVKSELVMEGGVRVSGPFRKVCVVYVRHEPERVYRVAGVGFAEASICSRCRGERPCGCGA